MTRSPDHDLQMLLAEEPFVRGLACALASHDADDVAQQTWLLALQHRGPVQQPRSWLRRIATNVAANLTRGERRRGERQRTAAVRERAPSSAELMEREERRSALVRAVDRLPVDLREVVLLRWFEGLPPRRIAAALGLPVTTVWNRLRSALQRLREGLDREHGGDRRAWLLPLLPRHPFPGEAGPALPLLVAGGWAMTTKTKVLVAFGVLLLLAGGFALWPETSAVAPALPPGASPMVAAASAPGNAATLDPASATPERTEPSVPAAASTGALLVRVRRGDDRSAAARETLVLSPVGVDSPTAATLHRTDDRGEVRVDSLAPGTMKVSLLQYQKPQRVEIRAGQLTELDYVLPAGVAVTGIVVDAEERGVAGAGIDLVDFGNTDEPTTIATTDAEGRFALRHVWPMSLIGARSAEHVASRLQMLMGSEGSAVEVKIQLLASGGALEGTVWGPDQRPVTGALVRVGSDGLRGPISSLGVDSVAIPVRTDAQGRFRALGLKAGEHRVFVRAPGLAPWQGQCFVVLRATAALRIDLLAGATCNGVVRDEAGTPLAGVEVRTGKVSEFTWCGAETASDGSFTLTGLAVGELEVRAEHQQFGATKAVVATRAGAAVACDLVLSRGIELRGRVLDQDGVGFSGVYVHAYGGGSSMGGSTDAEGRFTLVNCPSGLVTVSAMLGQQDVRREQVDPRQGEVELRLTRPAPPQLASVRIRGQLIGADGRGVAGVSVSTSPTGDRQHSCATAEDGTFELGPLVPGKWTVYVPAQRYPSWSSGTRELAADAVWDLGSVQLVAGGTALVEVLGAKAGAEVTFSIRDAGGGHGSGQWIKEHVLRTWALAPGEYRIHLAADGCARRWVPFTIRAGEEVRVPARLEPGVRQRCEFVRADGTRPGDVAHGLRCGAEVLIEMGTLVYWDRPPVYAADGAMTAELWLAPGTYRLDARERAVTGSAEFTVTASEGPVVRIVLH